MLDRNKLAHYANDPAAFRADLLIDAGGRIVAFRNVMDDWQDADFRALDNGWKRAVGLPADDGCSRGYLERPRGHSKTLDLAVMACWAMAFAMRQVLGAVAAGDKDQAALIRGAIERLILLNPLLGQALDATRYAVTNRRTGSKLEILAADAATSYGLLLDFVLVDEITHWPTGAAPLWHSLISTVAKRERCLCGVISNAGFEMGTSWQWQAREAARESPDWHFHSLNGARASWISPKLLAEQQRLLPPAAYRRLWLNEWSSGAGDAIDPADLDAALTLDGPSKWEPRMTYLGALDLGLKRDHTGFCVLGLDARMQRMRLAHMRTWAPLPNAPVSLEEVRKEITRLALTYKLRALVLDPWQGVHLAEHLRTIGLRVIEIPFTTKSLNLMATAALEVFRNRRIDLYRDPGLMRDLARLQIVETTLGYRLSAPRTRGEGHADLATALAMGVTVGRDWLKQIPIAEADAKRPRLRTLGG